MKINIIAVIISCMLISCNDSKKSPSLPIEEKKTNLDELQPYTSIELYCWCFHIEQVVSEKGIISPHSKDCETLSPTRASSLIRAEHLLFSSKKNEDIYGVTNQIFQNKRGTDSLNIITEPRFIILLRRNDNYMNDTLVYRSGIELEYNEKLLLKYNISIMDSIRKVLKISIIDCN